MDQITHQDTAGQGFAQAPGIGNQNALPGLLQCLDGRIELIRHRNLMKTGVMLPDLADIYYTARFREWPARRFCAGPWLF